MPAPALESLLPNSSLRRPNRNSTRPRPTTSKLRTIWSATSNWWTSRKSRNSNTIRPSLPPQPELPPYRPLVPPPMLPSQQVTQAQEKLRQGEASWRNAQTGPQQMQAMRSKAASARADAQRKKADLDQAQLNLQYTKIVAPVAGVVSDRTVEVGQNVAPGQEFMKIIPLNDVWITANFKETQLRDMKPGQPRHRGSRRQRTKATKAKSTASPARAAPVSASCRPKTPPAIT